MRLCGFMTMSLAICLLWIPTGSGEPPLPARPEVQQAPRSALGVCPPFHLRDETGQIIDPVHGVNDSVPYSPRQTCGAEGCHDYATITQGYHFTQGKGESAPSPLAERVAWALTPGNYGGPWCSPAPLYKYLAPQQNETPQTIDMTSFTFIAAGCGDCHPGGGPLEYDRSGRRYDLHMADPESGLVPGGENGLDGDYYRARWTESGVIEADCLICHSPGYNFRARKEQIARLNYRWTATAGAGFASVDGSVKAGQPPRVRYDLSRFSPDGTVSIRIVLSPRNDTCLECHAQPGWKKRGANFRSRTDVHLRAGLRCTDCHQAGSKADDPRIRGHEVHQIGKGDDPGGRVRDDLDNTVRGCDSCHSTGLLGAPIARHPGLPALHLERIACQTCHIPERPVQPISLQASDVVSPGTRIPSPGKQLWTFYGPDMTYRNHYGFLEMMGYDDKPTEAFKPGLVRYKGKIYPVNRVHSTWPGIELEGQTALMQPRMSDVRTMWDAHAQDPARYPKLASIMDDNADGALEVNRPEEIEALIASIDERLRELGYPMEGKRVVWVMNDRVYRNGSEFRVLEKEPWEASPYGNTHKYSHDVYPARSALGAGGCTDCHSTDSEFFFARVPVIPFSPDGAQPMTVPQHEVLGFSRAEVILAGWREEYLKPSASWVFGLILLLLLFHLVIVGPFPADSVTAKHFSLYSARERLSHLWLMGPFLILCSTGVLFLFRLEGALSEPARRLHGWVGLVFAAGIPFMVKLWAADARFRPSDRTWLKGLGGYLGGTPVLWEGRFNPGQKLFFWLVVLCGLLLSLTGVAMQFGWSLALGPAILYTLHDLLAIALISMILVHLYLALLVNPGRWRLMFGAAAQRRSVSLPS